MKFLIFSDIHGNDFVLDQLQCSINNYNPDKILFLGDIFGYFYNYKNVIDFILKNNINYLLGNHDKLAIDILMSEDMDIEAYVNNYGSGYKFLKLNEMFYLNYLKSAPLSINMKVDGYKICFVHGSTDDALYGRIYPDTIIKPEIFNDFDLIFCGHTHHRVIKYYDNKLIVNVGSIGWPRDEMNPCYVTFDTEKNAISFKDILFDFNILKRQMIYYNDENKPYFHSINKIINKLKK
jgi:putative phosphoesterase